MSGIETKLKSWHKSVAAVGGEMSLALATRRVHLSNIETWVLQLKSVAHRMEREYERSEEP